MKSLKFVAVLMTLSLNAYSFDLEDYATTFRATRDAYMKQANEVELALPVILNKKQLLEDSCYKITGIDLANLKGLRSGSCLADGVAASNSVSLGQKISDLINMTPAFVTLPNFSNIIQWGSQPVNASQVNMDLWGVDSNTWSLTPATITIEKDSSCSPKNSYVNDGNIEDMKASFIAVYESFRQQAYWLQKSIGPYKAAHDAYVAATTVYTMGIGCESQIGERSAELYDPYVP